jgi:hypothetical protein
VQFFSSFKNLSTVGGNAATGSRIATIIWN